MLQIQPLEFKKLKGLHTRKALTDFMANEALSCVGGYFDVYAAYTKRRGGAKYNTIPLAAPISGIYDFRYSNDTLQDILITSGTDLYHGNGGVPISVKSGLTPGTYPDFVTYDDKAWIVNGADALFTDDGTNVNNAGINRPVGVPTAVSSNGAGNLTPGDVFSLAITYLSSSDGESNPSDIVNVTIAGGDDQIDLSNIPVSPDPQVTKRNIYITDANGALLKFHGTINDNVTTVYTILDVDNLTFLLEYDHDVAPVGLKAIEVHKDRLFGFKESSIYFSKAFDVAYWPQGEFDQEQIFIIPVGNSDPIIGIKSFFDVLLIFKRYDVYVLSGDDELNFRIDRVRSDERVGTVSDRTIKVIGNYCYFLGVNSVYRTNGITIEDVGDPIGDFFDQNSSSTIYKVNKNYFESSCAEYYKELNLYLLFVPTGASTNNDMCFVMDVTSVQYDQESGKIRPDWVPWPGFNTQAVGIIVEDGIEKWFRGDINGFVYRQEALDGDGSNITSVSTGLNANNTLNDILQAWSNDLYASLRVNILKGTGAGQERTILSNTGTQLVVSPDWSVIPDETSVYTIGGIFWHYQHSWNDYGVRSYSKRWRYARPFIETSGEYDVDLSYGFDFSYVNIYTFAYSLSGVALWDSAFWDIDVWDGKAIIQSKLSVPGNRIHRFSNFKIENNAAGQPVKYMGVDKLYQMKGIR